MKRLSSYLTVILLAAGCTLDQANNYDPDMELVFHPAMHLATKAEINEEYPIGQTFTASAWTLDKGHFWAEESSQSEVYLNNASVYFTENGFKLGKDTLWPATDKSLTVVACTPTDAFVSISADKGAECSYDMLLSQADILYTDPQADLNKIDCGGVIALPFRHALCQVDFMVKNRVAKDEEILIKSIKIDGVKHRGTFASLPEPTWTIGPDEVSLLFFEGDMETTNTPEDIGDSWLIIPQELTTNVTVEYEYRTSADTGFTLTLKTCDLQTKLEPGRHYTYTLSVGIDDVKFLLEIIEDRFK